MPPNFFRMELPGLSRYRCTQRLNTNEKNALYSRVTWIENRTWVREDGGRGCDRNDISMRHEDYAWNMAPCWRREYVCICIRASVSRTRITFHQIPVTQAFFASLSPDDLRIRGGSRASFCSLPRMKDMLNFIQLLRLDARFEFIPRYANKYLYDKIDIG